MAPLYIDELATDTWELSLYDSDYDDGFKPVAREKKIDAVTKDEWQEGVPRCFSVLEAGLREC